MTHADPDPDALADALLRWWDADGRYMPWRKRRDPYAVWVSEIMLQQTRAETVTRYYDRFLERFPTPADLARADEADVLKAWEGLGYYRRARNLHAAARAVTRDHAGRLPDTLDGLRELPGVGAYTAAAIASIAFGRPAAVLDGNVMRVMCRACRVRQDPRGARTRRRLLARVEAAIAAAGDAGRINQALMDLGATLCTPRRPACGDCPLAGMCLARAAGEQENLPRKPPRKRTPHYDVAVGVVVKRGRLLIDRRERDAMLGGLWELPGGKLADGETPEDAVVRELREEVGIEVRPIGPLATVRHAYSHFRVTLHAIRCRHLSGRARALACDAVRWAPLDGLDEYAFPTGTHKILAHLPEARS